MGNDANPDYRSCSCALPMVRDPGCEIHGDNARRTDGAKNAETKMPVWTCDLCGRPASDHDSDEVLFGVPVNPKCPVDAKSVSPAPPAPVHENEVQVIGSTEELSAGMRLMTDVRIFEPHNHKILRLCVARLEATILAAWKQRDERDETIRGLREIVDKLPKTADGVRLVIGMTVWERNHNRVYSLVVPEGFNPDLGWTACYSTEALALAASSSPATPNETEAR